MRSGADVDVAVGGDGTINRVLNGLLGPEENAARCTMGVLYSGTSPDFCRFHGIPTDPENAVRTLLAGNSSPVDICRIRYRGSDGKESLRYFGCSANIGLGPGIAGRANRYRKYLGDFLGTLLATVIAAIKLRPPSCRLQIDGEQINLDSVINITIGKNPYLASGLKLNLDISENDGRIFVFAAPGVGKISFFSLLPKVYSGSVVKDKRFVLRWASPVSLQFEPADTEIEFDGDPAGFCPVEVELVPGAIRLIGAKP